MQVKFVRSGGLAGLDLVATVDTDNLAQDQQDVVSRLLSEDLRDPGGTRSSGADQFTYQLEIQDGDRTVRRVWVEPDVHEMLRPLLTAITRQAKPAS